MTDKAQSSIVAGWREWVSLPGAGVPWIKAKLDTGARSSSVHAYDVTLTGEDASERVRFRLQPWQESREDAVVVECPIHDRRHVRSSSGHVEERIVVIMRIALLGREIETEMTLSNRDEMGFRMLIGRQALRQGFLVDPAKSFLGGRAPREIRRRNRDR
ncbi:MAG: hypothetical protein CMF57_03080 [Leifsonia sp.]|nr:hypothetical protein [Leifsonia sp.]